MARVNNLSNRKHVKEFGAESSCNKNWKTFSVCYYCTFSNDQLGRNLLQFIIRLKLNWKNCCYLFNAKCNPKYFGIFILQKVLQNISPFLVTKTNIIFVWISKQYPKFYLSVISGSVKGSCFKYQHTNPLLLCWGEKERRREFIRSNYRLDIPSSFLHSISFI